MYVSKYPVYFLDMIEDKVGEDFVIYDLIWTVLTDVSPVMTGYASMRVINTDQYFTSNSDFSIIYCVTV